MPLKKKIFVGTIVFMLIFSMDAILQFWVLAEAQEQIENIEEELSADQSITEFSEENLDNQESSYSEYSFEEDNTDESKAQDTERMEESESSEEQINSMQDEREISYENKTVRTHMMPARYLSPQWYASAYTNVGSFNTTWISHRVAEITMQINAYDMLMRLGRDGLGYKVGDSVTANGDLWPNGGPNTWREFNNISDYYGLGFQRHRGWNNVVSVPAISSGVGVEHASVGFGIYGYWDPRVYRTIDGVLQVTLQHNSVQLERLKSAPLTDTRWILHSGDPNVRMSYNHYRWGSAGARLNDELSVDNYHVIHNNGRTVGALPAWDVARTLVNPPQLSVTANTNKEFKLNSQPEEIIKELVNVTNTMDGGKLEYLWDSGVPDLSTPGLKSSTIRVIDRLGDFEYSSRVNVNFQIVDERNFWGTSEWILHEDGKLEIREGHFDPSSFNNRPTWYQYRDDIKTIEFVANVEANSLSSYLFADLPNLKEFIGLNRLNTSNVKNMNYMFNNLREIKELNLDSFDTKNVESMDYMFNYMYGLEKLDLRSFDTSNVISMVGLFQGMINLKDLYISNFDTSNVISMNYMFSGLWNIRDLEISNFNTSSVVNMNYMFSYLYSVNHLDLTNFNTSNVISMNYMFAESLIKEINLSSFTVSPETTTQGMLIGARYIDTLHLGPYFRFNGTEELRTLSEGEMWKGDVIGKEFSTSEDFMSNFYGTEQADIYRVIPKSIEVKIPVDMIFRSNINDLTILESNQYLIENLSGFSINVKLNSIKNVKNLSSIEYLKINESVLVLDGKENVLEDNFLMTLHANEVRELYFSGQAKEVEKEENPQFTMSMKFIHTDL